MWSEHRTELPAGGESPLVGLQAVLAAARPRFGPAFGCREQALLEFVNLRGRDPQAMSGAVQAATGAVLPSQANTVAVGASHTAWWLGPDEWLLQSHAPCVPRLERSLRTPLAEHGGSVVDVGSGYTALVLEGREAATVLRKGCPLDLHPRVFTLGQCAQSHFFKASVLLRPLRDGAWQLVVRRSFADYCASLLLDAAQEFLA